MAFSSSARAALASVSAALARVSAAAALSSMAIRRFSSSLRDSDTLLLAATRASSTARSRLCSITASSALHTQNISRVRGAAARAAQILPFAPGTRAQILMSAGHGAVAERLSLHVDVLVDRFQGVLERHVVLRLDAQEQGPVGREGVYEGLKRLSVGIQPGAETRNGENVRGGKGAPAIVPLITGSNWEGRKKKRAASLCPSSADAPSGLHLMFAAPDGDVPSSAKGFERWSASRSFSSRRNSSRCRRRGCWGPESCANPIQRKHKGAAPSAFMMSRDSLRSLLSS